mgnify:CR=1 FL=1
MLSNLNLIKGLILQILGNASEIVRILGEVFEIILSFYILLFFSLHVGDLFFFPFSLALGKMYGLVIFRSIFKNFYYNNVYKKNLLKNIFHSAF